MVDEDRLHQSRRWKLVVVGTFVVFLAVRLSLDSMISVLGSIIFVPSAGLAVPLGIAFGLPAAVGILVAALVAQALQVGFTLLGVFESVALFVLAVVSALAWQSEITVPSRSVVSVDGISGFVIVTTVGSTGAASIFAWGGEILGLFPFYVMFIDTLLRYLVATSVVGPVVITALALGTEQPIYGQPSERSTLLGPGFVLVPVLWAVLALVGSIGFNIRERVPREIFELYGVEHLYHLIHPDLFGSGGRRVQVVFGAVMLVGWLFVFWNAGFTNSAEASSNAHEDGSVPSSLDSEQTTLSSGTDEMEVR